MAEYLVYNINHWIDKLIENNSSTLSTIDLTEFEIRYIKGDIIQVYEDGECTESPALNSPFVIIKCYKQQVDKKYQKAKVVDKTQEEIDDEWLEKADQINAWVDVYMVNRPTADRVTVLAEIRAESIEETKITDRREYYFDMPQINTSQNKVIQITTTQFNNLVKSK